MAQRDEREVLALAVMELVDVAHRRISRSVDLTRLRILGLIAERGPLRPRQVASALDLTASATSRHLTALQRDGRLEVSDDLTDERTFLVGIAPGGTGEVEAALAAGTARFRRAVQDWSDEEIDQAQRVIDRLMASFAPAPADAPDVAARGARWRTGRRTGETT